MRRTDDVVRNCYLIGFALIISAMIDRYHVIGRNWAGLLLLPLLCPDASCGSAAAPGVLRGTEGLEPTRRSTIITLVVRDRDRDPIRGGGS